MRYTLTAVVAASFAATTLAAHGHQNAHHQHHAREAEAEPAAEAEPEPTNYTYSDGQCWGTYGCNAKTGAPAAAAAPTAAAASPAQVEAQATSAAGKAVAQATSAAAAVASPAASKSSGSSSSGSSSSGGSVSVSNILSKAGSILAAVEGSSCVEGSGNKNVVNIENQSGEDLVWVCWGSAGSWVNVKAPIMALGISSGASKTISFQDTPSGQQGGACAPVTLDTVTANGQINNTWLEATFNQYGTVDVSREVNMMGHSITAKTAAGCTSSMDNCVFKCNSETGESGSGHCGDAGSYGLKSCTGTGVNASPSDPSDGGCQVGSGTMSVTIGPKANSY